MRALAAVLVCALAGAPLAAAPASQTGVASGVVVLQEWDVYNLWVNTTGPVTLTLAWTLETAAEDLSFTVWKPGVWDADCGRTAQACEFRSVQQPGDVVVQSFGCPPFHASESAGWAHVGAKRYHVSVEGNAAWTVGYTLTASRGSLTYNGTTDVFVTFVPPC